MGALVALMMSIRPGDVTSWTLDHQIYQSYRHLDAGAVLCAWRPGTKNAIGQLRRWMRHCRALAKVLYAACL